MLGFATETELEDVCCDGDTVTSKPGRLEPAVEVVEGIEEDVVVVCGLLVFASFCISVISCAVRKGLFAISLRY